MGKMDLSNIRSDVRSTPTEELEAWFALPLLRERPSALGLTKEDLPVLLEEISLELNRRRNRAAG